MERMEEEERKDIYHRWEERAAHLVDNRDDIGQGGGPHPMMIRNSGTTTRRTRLSSFFALLVTMTLMMGLLWSSGR